MDDAEFDALKASLLGIGEEAGDAGGPAGAPAPQPDAADAAADARALRLVNMDGGGRSGASAPAMKDLDGLQSEGPEKQARRDKKRSKRRKERKVIRVATDEQSSCQCFRVWRALQMGEREHSDLRTRPAAAVEHIEPTGNPQTSHSDFLMAAPAGFGARVRSPCARRREISLSFHASSSQQVLRTTIFQNQSRKRKRL